MSTQTIINQDCLEYMRTLPDKSFDLVLTDPPYGTTQCAWDTVIPFDDMWQELKRVTKKNGAVILFGSEPFSSALRMSNIKEFKYDWIWNKRKGANVFNIAYSPLKTHEIISVFYSHSYYPIMRKGEPRKDKYTTNKSDMYGGGLNKVDTENDGEQYNPISILEFGNSNNKDKWHPTQKPVELLEYLVETYSREGETVLDFTMGSGTTLVACKHLNRNCVGIEISEKYCKIAQERLDSTPTPLF